MGRLRSNQADGAAVSQLRCTTEAPGGAYVRGTMYDVRCTIEEFARGARGRAKLGRGDVMELCTGIVRKGRGQTVSAYVRFTMYD